MSRILTMSPISSTFVSSMEAWSRRYTRALGYWL